MNNIKMFEDFEYELHNSFLTTKIDNLQLYGLDLSNLVPIKDSNDNFSINDADCKILWNIDYENNSDNSGIENIRIVIEDIFFNFVISIWGDEEDTDYPISFKLKDLKLKQVIEIDYNNFPIMPKEINLDYRRKEITIC